MTTGNTFSEEWNPSASTSRSSSSSLRVANDVHSKTAPFILTDSYGFSPFTIQPSTSRKAALWKIVRIKVEESLKNRQM